MKSGIYVLFIAVCLVVVCPVYASDTESAYIIGEVKDGLYTNRAMGAEIFLGENWRILSREEISANYGYTASVSPTMKELTAGKMPSFLAITNDGLANINITITKLGVAGGALLSDSMNEFVDELMRTLADGLKKSYSEMGFDDFRIKRNDLNFIGSKYPGLSITSSMKQVTMYQKQVMCLRGEYCFHVTATSLGVDITDSLMAMFRKH